MFICNIKLSKIFKIFFISVSIILLIFFFIGAHKIFSQAYSYFKVSDKIPETKVVELTTNNYTDVLKAVHEDIDSYVGINIHFSGYVYRLLDFKDTQFVLARNMIISSDFKAVVVGFLCDYKNAKEFDDNCWVEVTGKITKGNYNGNMPIIEVTDIKQIDPPKEEYVYPPDDTYIPTQNIL